MTESTSQEKSQIEQLANGFELTTGRFLEDSQNQVELAIAAGDKVEIAKAQIRVEMLRQTRKIFAHNYRRIMGHEPWGASEGEKSHG